MKKSRILITMPALFILLASYNNCSPPTPADNYIGAASSSTNPTPPAGSNPQIVAFNGDGTGWTLNGGAAVDTDVATLTDRNGGEARSLFLNEPVTLTQGFTASFVYQDVDATPGDADGITFTIQNSPDGPGALGASGGALGYLGISTSMAVAFDIYTRSAIAVATGGAGYDYIDTAPVDLKGGNPIQVQIDYNAGLQSLHVVLTDTATLDNFENTFENVNLATNLGGLTGYVGFTGGTGGAIATQQVNGFSFAY
ncbi:MAG: L-type lectin-domain containing protein [Bdellovibrionales bacterium]